MSNYRALSHPMSCAFCDSKGMVTYVNKRGTATDMCNPCYQRMVPLTNDPNVIRDWDPVKPWPKPPVTEQGALISISKSLKPPSYQYSGDCICGFVCTTSESWEAAWQIMDKHKCLTTWNQWDKAVGR